MKNAAGTVTDVVAAGAEPTDGARNFRSIRKRDAGFEIADHVHGEFRLQSCRSCDVPIRDEATRRCSYVIRTPEYA
jgi:hypothetical protein